MESFKNWWRDCWNTALDLFKPKHWIGKALLVVGLVAFLTCVTVAAVIVLSLYFAAKCIIAAATVLAAFLLAKWQLGLFGYQMMDIDYHTTFAYLVIVMAVVRLVYTGTKKRHEEQAARQKRIIELLERVLNYTIDVRVVD